MVTRPVSLLLASLSAALAASPARADVFELNSSGDWVNVAAAPLHPEPVTVPDSMPAPNPAPAIASANHKTAYVQQHIQHAAARYGVNGALLDAVAWQESRYNHRAVSSAGAVGVMQLMPATARSLGVTDPRDVAQNVAGGNNVPLALAAYNAGPGAVLRHGGIPPYQETQNYVRQIMGRLARTAIISEAH
jgi:soluble lytic murein transglycosylase-like protein